MNSSNAWVHRRPDRSRGDRLGQAPASTPTPRIELPASCVPTASAGPTPSAYDRPRSSEARNAPRPRWPQPHAEREHQLVVAQRGLFTITSVSASACSRGATSKSGGNLQRPDLLRRPLRASRPIASAWPPSRWWTGSASRRTTCRAWWRTSRSCAPVTMTIGTARIGLCSDSQSCNAVAAACHRNEAVNGLSRYQSMASVEEGTVHDHARISAAIRQRPSTSDRRRRRARRVGREALPFGSAAKRRLIWSGRRSPIHVPDRRRAALDQRPSVFRFDALATTSMRSTPASAKIASTIIPRLPNTACRDEQLCDLSLQTATNAQCRRRQYRMPKSSIASEAFEPMRRDRLEADHVPRRRGFGRFEARSALWPNAVFAAGARAYRETLVVEVGRDQVHRDRNRERAAPSGGLLDRWTMTVHVRSSIRPCSSASGTNGRARSGLPANGSSDKCLERDAVAAMQPHQRLIVQPRADPVAIAARSSSAAMRRCSAPRVPRAYGETFQANRLARDAAHVQPGSVPIADRPQHLVVDAAHQHDRRRDLLGGQRAQQLERRRRRASADPSGRASDATRGFAAEDREIAGCDDLVTGARPISCTTARSPSRRRSRAGVVRTRSACTPSVEQSRRRLAASRSAGRVCSGFGRRNRRRSSAASVLSVNPEVNITLRSGRSSRARIANSRPSSWPGITMSVSSRSTLRGSANVERIVRALGDDHVIPERVQLQRRDLAHRLVVVDDQDRLLAAVAGAVAAGTDGCWRRCSIPRRRRRQVEPERRADADLAVDADVSAGLLGEAEYLAQAKARPVGAFGGEERLEHLGLRLGRHSDAGVGDGDHHVLARLDVDARLGVILVEDDVGALDRRACRRRASRRAR